MARAMWSGAISFGLVNVPVKLFPSVSRKELHFNMMHRADGGRIQLKRFCSVDGKEVPYEEIVKGYPLSKTQYVLIEPEEIEKLEPEATHTIDIEQFVRQEEIDPVYYDTTYYVAPDERGAKGYAVLIKAMEKTGRVAIAKMVLRVRQHLCELRPADGRLMLTTMLFADEIVSPESLDVPKADIPLRARELEMAEELVNSLAEDFDPRQFRDEYRERVLEIIERKAAGETIPVPARARRVAVSNLADALAASLARASQTSRGERRAPETRPAARTRRKPPSKRKR